jgi:hypothetical protein
MTPYDFRQLSSIDFEELVRDLLQAEWGIRFQSFPAGRDSGIDLQYTNGRDPVIVVQCKHYINSGVRKLISDLRHAETVKVHKLKPNRYVLTTSLPLTLQNKNEILSIFDPYIASTADILGQNDLNNLIASHPGVEQSHFKLWLTSSNVLQRVIHNAEMCETDFELDRVRRKMHLYVPNSAYSKAVEILQQTNIVVITGAPGVGKTTLADMVLYSHLEHGYQPVVIRADLKEGKRLFRNGVKQIFYFDDFLGQSFLRDQTGFQFSNQDSALVDFMHVIRASKTARFILTTREHLLRGALLDSERLRHSPILQHRCIVEMSNYSLAEKGRMLFNHLFFSDLPDVYIKQLLLGDFFLAIIKHPNFNPRVIEWLASFSHVKSTPSEKYAVLFRNALDKPDEIWRHSFSNQISEASRSALFALYLLGGQGTIDALERAWSQFHRIISTKYHIQTRTGEFRRSLKELDGAFLRYIDAQAKFLNPSINDFISTFLIGQPDTALDLINSAWSLNQIGRIWHLAESQSGAPIASFLKRHQSQLVFAVEKILTEKSSKKLVLRRDAVQDDLGQDEFGVEATARLILRLTNALADPRMRKFFQKAGQDIVDNWKSHYPDFDEGLSLLIELDQSSWGKSFGRNIRWSFLNDFVGASVKDFIRLIEVSQQLSDWRFEDTEVAAQAFERFTLENLGEARQRCSSVAELEQLRDDMQTVGAFFEADIDESLEFIAHAIDETYYEHYDDEPPDDWRPWRRLWGDGPNVEEEAVRTLFRTLAARG